MEHAVAGRQNREIAAQMSISARTVEVYKARLMDKLDVRTNWTCGASPSCCD
jgi:DNA-binding NarL/FixJ family response regulator